MFVLRGRNVNVLYQKAITLLREHGVVETSRNGTVITAPEPVTSVYDRPWERVLFDRRRDANPFFHLAEAVWMISGSRDARFLDRWVSDFSSRFAESNGEAHGAYGYRWRDHWRDQLLDVGELLRKDPTTRRAVITMWDPDIDFDQAKKDLPCNQQVLFRTRKRVADDGTESMMLDMTVTCRSNDMFWGAYGANSVHFSFLGEIVAGLAEMTFGKYYQVSNNFHVYTAVTDKISTFNTPNPYSYDSLRTRPLLSGSSGITVTHKDALNFIGNCENWTEYLLDPEKTTSDYLAAFPSFAIKREPWFEGTFFPMMLAHEQFKAKKYTSALDTASKVESQDWSAAASSWLERRILKATNGAISSRGETR